MEIDWSKAPEWARYAAKDLSGCWAWYEDKPWAGESAWLCWRRKEPISKHYDWKESLTVRPQND